MKIVKTWLLETEEERSVYEDANGRFTLEAEGNCLAEFREGENPGDDKEAWAKAATALLNVKCHCVPGPSWTEDEVYG